MYRQLCHDPDALAGQPEESIRHGTMTGLNYPKNWGIPVLVRITTRMARSTCRCGRTLNKRLRKQNAYAEDEHQRFHPSSSAGS